MSTEILDPNSPKGQLAIKNAAYLRPTTQGDPPPDQCSCDDPSLNVTPPLMRQIANRVALGNATLEETLRYIVSEHRDALDSLALTMHDWAQMIRLAEDQQTLLKIADDIDVNANALAPAPERAP